MGDDEAAGEVEEAEIHRMNGSEAWRFLHSFPSSKEIHILEQDILITVVSSKGGCLGCESEAVSIDNGSDC